MSSLSSKDDTNPIISETLKVTEQSTCWMGAYQYGQVIIQDTAAIQHFTKLGIGSMKLYHANTLVTRERFGQKPKATEITEEKDEIVISPSMGIVEVNTVQDKSKAPSFNGETAYDLALSEEEALFLCHRGQLQVIDIITGLSITTEALFDKFLESRGRALFPIQYAVYAFFKNRKFVVKSGINFGMDYCVYRDSPEKVHSELCIRVINALSAPTILPVTQTMPHLEDLGKIESEADSPTVHNSMNSSKDKDDDTISKSINHNSDDSNATNDNSNINNGGPLHTYQLPYREYTPSHIVATADPNYEQLSWRTLSTMTRVMPDVMKLGLLCYVLPKDWENNSSTNAITDNTGNLDTNDASSSLKMNTQPAIQRYAHLFQTQSQNDDTDNINNDDSGIKHSSSSSSCSSGGGYFSTIKWPVSPAEIEALWTVRPVSVMVRRLPVANGKYPRADILQRRYKAGARINQNYSPSVEGGGDKKDNSNSKKQSQKKEKATKSSTNDNRNSRDNNIGDIGLALVDSEKSILVEENIHNEASSDHEENDEVAVSFEDYNALDQNQGVPQQQQGINISGQKRARDEENVIIPEKTENVTYIASVVPPPSSSCSFSTYPMSRTEDPTIANTAVLEDRNNISNISVNAFKRSRVRRNVEEVREKAFVAKKATIWELLSMPEDN